MPQDALAHGNTVAALDERLALPGHVEVEGEIVGPLVPPDMQDVAEAVRRQHPAFGAVVFQRDVGRRGRAVHDAGDLLHGDAADPADPLDALDNLDRLVSKPRGHLVIEHAVGAFEHEVCVRAADVNADPCHDKSPNCTGLARPANGRASGVCQAAWRGANEERVRSR